MRKNVLVIIKLQSKWKRKWLQKIFFNKLRLRIANKKEFGRVA